MIGFSEIGLILLVVVVVIFGASKLPEIGRGLGEAIRNFKKGVSEPPEINVTPKKGTKEEPNPDKENKS